MINFIYYELISEVLKKIGLNCRLICECCYNKIYFNNFKWVGEGL